MRLTILFNILYYDFKQQTIDEEDIITFIDETRYLRIPSVELYGL